jgi:hypothetical protein
MLLYAQIIYLAYLIACSNSVLCDETFYTDVVERIPQILGMTSLQASPFRPLKTLLAHVKQIQIACRLLGLRRGYHYQQLTEQTR